MEHFADPLDFIRSLKEAQPSSLDRSLPGPFVELTVDGLPVAIQVGRSKTGRLICTGLLVGWASEPQEVTRRILNEVQLGKILASVQQLAISEMEDAPEIIQHGHPGRKGWSDSHLREVATAYRQALTEKPGAPIALMSKRMHANRRTIHRWVAKSRARGFLDDRTDSV